MIEMLLISKVFRVSHIPSISWSLLGREMRPLKYVRVAKES